MYCIFCRSSSRKRHVAQALQRELGPEVASIAMLPQIGSELRILSASIDDPFRRVLHDYEHFFCSDLLPGVPPGKELEERVFCQDLEKLTFPDRSFDVVITEDVLEHVKYHEKAFREAHRVLSDRGVHIFTVPFVFDQPTIVRFDTENDLLLLPPEYHDDSLRGRILAYRTFGIDMYELLEKIGFRTVVSFSTFKDLGCGIVDSYVFVSRKRE